MVIDTSALVAILLGEPEAEPFAPAIAKDPKRLICAFTALRPSETFPEPKSHTLEIAMGSSNEIKGRTEILQGKRILVTQAGEFMGPMLCEVLAEHGAEVVATSIGFRKASTQPTLL